MLLYTGIYNPNSLPVKHYRFRLDFNFWRIIALAHIRMSSQYAGRQQQHRDRQSQGQLSRETSQITAEPRQSANAGAESSSGDGTAPGAAPELLGMGSRGFLEAEPPSQPG